MKSEPLPTLPLVPPAGESAATPPAAPRPAGGSLVRRVIKDAVLAFLGGSAGRALLYLAQFALARWLGPLDFGLFSLALNATQLLSVVAGFGFYLAVVRFTSIYLEQGMPEQARRLMARLLRLLFPLTALLALTMVLWPGGWARLLREPEVAGVLPLMALALPFLALSRLLVSGLNGLGSARLRALFESTLPALLFLLAIVLLHQASRLSLAGTATSHVLAWGVTTVAGGWTLWRLLPRPRGPAAPLDWRPVLRFAWGAWGVALLNQLSQRLDVLLAGFLLDGADIGIYSAAALIALAMNFVMNAFNMAASPSFATWQVKENRQDLARLYRQGTRVLLMVGLLMSLVFALGAGDLMHLLGEQFALGRMVLLLLIAGQLFNLAVGSAGHLLIMSGYQRAELLTVLFSVLVNVFLALLMVPLWGLAGLALAAGVAVAVRNLLRLLLVYWLLGVHPYDRSFLGLLGSGLLAGLAGLLLQRALTEGLGTAWLRFAGMALGTSLVYLGLVAALGFTRREKAWLAGRWKRFLAR